MDKDFRKKIKLYDKQDMMGAISSFPDQINKSFNLISEFNFELKSRVDQIVFLGMGGSAIGGDFTKSILSNCIPIPIHICRSYEIPKWVNNNTLVIACSYSGNTEETLSAFSESIQETHNIIVVSTGGKIVSLAKDKNIPCLFLPMGFQPRAALGLSIMLNLLLLNKIGLIPYSIIEDIKNGVNDLESFSFSLASNSSFAYSIALKINGYIPVIYGSYGFGDIIGLRFANQLSENSKILSFSNSIPEQNHNEIEGWSDQNSYEKKICAIFVKDFDDNPRIVKRQKILKEIISKLNILAVDIEANHKSRTIRLLKLIHLVDYISFYLAILNDINPSPVETIEKFKLSLLNE